MNVLEHQSTKKSRDDSRIHHILDDAMFKPRKRVSKTVTVRYRIGTYKRLITVSLKSLTELLDCINT